MRKSCAGGTSAPVGAKQKYRVLEWAPASKTPENLATIMSKGSTQKCHMEGLARGTVCNFGQGAR